MKKILLTLSALVIGFGAQTVLANDHGSDDHSATIKIEKAYAFSTAEMQKNGAVFLEIHNMSGTDDRLVSATTDVSETVELHTMSMDENDMMMMREVEAFDVADGATASLTPGGDHIMVMGLKEPLAVAKGAFDLTLTFENAGEMTVSVDVVPAGTKPE